MAPDFTGNPQDFIIDPERALAISYAPAGVRAALAVLFALDERLGAVVGRMSEPGIGLIRLAWWREALQALDAAAPPPEPLLAAVSARLMPLGIPATRLSELEDGWRALIDNQPDAGAIARHGAARGGTLFLAAGAVLGSADARLAAAGTGWALADLGHRHSIEGVRMEARRQAAVALDTVRGGWPRVIRPLGALAAIARSDARTASARRQGSPGRVARMLAHRLTGR